jgi:hypothetical protein
MREAMVWLLSLRRMVSANSRSMAYPREGNSSQAENGL